MTKIVAIKCDLLGLKCAQFDFGYGSSGGAQSASPELLAGFKECYF